MYLTLILQMKLSLSVTPYYSIPLGHHYNIDKQSDLTPQPSHFQTQILSVM